MKSVILKYTLVLGLVALAAVAHPQCEIRHRLYPDGTMLYYMEPVNFYWTESKDLKGGIVTDKENYFLELWPSPFPERPLGNKLKDDLEMKLSNDSIYRLEHFDTRYLDHDSVMQLLYLIDGKMLDELEKFEVVSVKINMKGTEGVRTYFFKLHKSAIKEQLTCFRNEKQKKKK